MKTDPVPPPPLCRVSGPLRLFWKCGCYCCLVNPTPSLYTGTVGGCACFGHVVAAGCLLYLLLQQPRPPVFEHRGCAFGFRVKKTNQGLTRGPAFFILYVSSDAATSSLFTGTVGGCARFGHSAGAGFLFGLLVRGNGAHRIFQRDRGEIYDVI